MKNLDYKNSDFWIKTMLFSGMSGYLYIGISLGIPSLFQTMFHPVFIYLTLNLMCICSYTYIFVKMLNRKDMSKKEIINCITLFPILIWSYLGHMGNADALSIILGDLIASLYSLILIPIYIFILIKTIMAICK